MKRSLLVANKIATILLLVLFTFGTGTAFAQQRHHSSHHSSKGHKRSSGHKHGRQGARQHHSTHHRSGSKHAIGHTDKQRGIEIRHQSNNDVELKDIKEEKDRGK